MMDSWLTVIPDAKRFWKTRTWIQKLCPLGVLICFTAMMYAEGFMRGLVL
jgi:hypothetical protein